MQVSDHFPKGARQDKPPAPLSANTCVTPDTGYLGVVIEQT